jgi:hypothetical protein
MGNAFEFLPLAFSIVLMLIVRFTLPIGYVVHTEDVVDGPANFDLGTVTDELVHGTAITDYVTKRVNKVRFGLHANDIKDMGFAPHKNLGTLISAEGGNRAVYGVGGNGFLTAVYVEGGKGGPICVTDCRAKLRATAGVLGRIVICGFDDGRVFMQKERTKGLVVAWSSGVISEEGRIVMGVLGHVHME